MIAFAVILSVAVCLPQMVFAEGRCPDGYQAMGRKHLDADFWQANKSLASAGGLVCIATVAPSMSSSSLGCPEAFSLYKEDVFLPAAGKRILEGKELSGFTCIAARTPGGREPLPGENPAVQSVEQFELERNGLLKDLDTATKEVVAYGEDRLKLATVELNRLCALGDTAPDRLSNALSRLPLPEQGSRAYGERDRLDRVVRGLRRHCDHAREIQEFVRPMEQWEALERRLKSTDVSMPDYKKLEKEIDTATEAFLRWKLEVPVGTLAKRTLNDAEFLMGEYHGFLNEYVARLQDKERLEIFTGRLSDWRLVGEERLELETLKEKSWRIAQALSLVELWFDKKDNLELMHSVSLAWWQLYRAFNRRRTHIQEGDDYEGCPQCGIRGFFPPSCEYGDPNLVILLDRNWVQEVLPEYFPPVIVASIACWLGPSFMDSCDPTQFCGMDEMERFACKHTPAVAKRTIALCVGAIQLANGTAIEEEIVRNATAGLNNMTRFPFPSKDCKKLARAYEKGAGREEVDAACKHGRETHKNFKGKVKEFKKAVRVKEWWRAKNIALELCERTDCVVVEGDEMYEGERSDGVCCYQATIENAQEKAQMDATRKAQRKRRKDLDKKKRSVPKFERICKKQAQINWRAVKNRKTAIGRGKLRAADRQRKIINNSYVKACDARRKALEVYHAYKSAGDSMAAGAVSNAIQSCIRYWDVCDR